jgi:2-keto-4-pentenoate hydratase
MQAAYEELAQQLAKAWRSGATLPAPAPEAAPRSRADAYAIQSRMIEILGERSIGWKVGAAVPAVQVMDGHDGPIIGRLLASRLFTSPATVPSAMVVGHKIESEVAFRFTADIPARSSPYTRAELEPHLVFHPGLEVAGSRYAPGSDRKPTTRDLIADNGVCVAYVVGEGVEDWREIDFATLPIDARVNGGASIPTFSGEYFRDPAEILVEIVNGLSDRGIDIASGELLTTGSLTLPTSIEAGQTYVARFGEFGTLSIELQ